MTDDDSILGLELTMRAITEILTRHPEGLSGEQLQAATGHLERLAIDAALFQAWATGLTVVGYDTEADELLWSPAP